MAQAGRSSEATSASGNRRSGMRLLLAAVLLFGLCWAVPGTATPFNWFGVNDFDPAASPSLAPGRLDSADVLLTADETLGRPQAESRSQGGDEALAAIARLASARTLLPASSGAVSAPVLPPVAANYRARAPPRVT